MLLTFLTFLVILVIKALDPIGLVIAAIGGFFMRVWWHVLLVAAVEAIIVQLILMSTQITRAFSQGLVISFAAALLNVSIVFGIVKYWRHRKSKA